MRVLGLVALAGCSAVTPVEPAPVEDEVEGTWLGVDLHLHSDHSNDALDNPIPALLDVARARGLDAFVLTDHDNHVEGAITTWSDPDLQVDDLLMLYGVEYTTAKGHANLFAPAPWDHPPIYALRDGEGRPIVDAAHAQGLHVSANHPLNGDPWEFGFDIGIDSLEVWNALFTFPTDNTAALALWDRLIGEGRRLPGRGGSDCHHQTGLEALGINVGNPTTWTLAPDRSGAGLLGALAAGRASVSYAPTAERLLWRADGDGDGAFETLMGDRLPADGAPITLRLDIEQPPAGATWRVTVLRNGVVWHTEEVSAPRVEVRDTPPVGENTWYRVEVRGAVLEAPEVAQALYGDLIGITNPIYVGFGG